VVDSRGKIFEIQRFPRLRRMEFLTNDTASFIRERPPDEFHALSLRSWEISKDLWSMMG